MRQRTVIGPGAGVVITLDTTAPSVVWGAVGGAAAGELLQLEYVADEAIATADVVLRDGRVIALTVGETVLEALLPVDTPEGGATVRVRDDVGNQRSYVGLLTLVGVPFVEPQPPSRRFPRERRRPSPSRLLRSRSVCDVASTATVRRRRRAPASARARSSSSLLAHLSAPSAASASARSSLRTRRGEGSRGVAATRTTVTRRGPEPPPAALILLDLL